MRQPSKALNQKSLRPNKLRRWKESSWIAFRKYIKSGDCVTPKGIIRVWGPLEWLGDKLNTHSMNGYFSVRRKGPIFQKIFNIPIWWKAFGHSFLKIYNIPWSTSAPEKPTEWTSESITNQPTCGGRCPKEPIQFALCLKTALAIFCQSSNYKNTQFLLSFARPSQKPSQDDISGPISGIIDPLVSKRIKK